MADATAQFTIIRDGSPEQAVDKDALVFGRLLSCDVALDHPAVSRIHAGINFLDDRFYVINLSSSNFVTVNGRKIAPSETDIIVDGDLVLIGPFAVRIAIKDQKLTAGVRIAAEADLTRTTQSFQRQPEALDSQKADILKVFWEKRSRDKDDWGSRLRPTAKPEPGKARINWKPTRDLGRAWRYGILTWCVLVIAAIAVFAYFTKPDTFAPMPLSSVHAATFSERQIAGQPNANSCVSCHAPNKSVETSCATCHQGEQFHASNTRKHQEAGITCIACHSEHRGDAYKSNESAEASCATCHNDLNKQTYNGKTVSTPHGDAQFNYPVLNGKWSWEGVEKAVAPQIPEVGGSATGDRDAQAKALREFHSIHVGRLTVPAGMTADSKGLVSCSTCHNTFSPIDIATPKETCASCHAPKSPTTGAVQSNCVSCHVQHPYSGDRWKEFLTPDALTRRRAGVAAQTEELRKR